ncbi:hypothetical protein E4T38_06287 [Aureobasidium subglaciale]|nr:hypothetical protein E4T38_06287 [Aureobasidium subglaciale]KAI5260437.1 hypothetical protein E4T46_06042 [Aureobasidium subglaciale]
MISQILLIIITIFLPPVGVFMIAGCGADLLINICLTVLGHMSIRSDGIRSFFPGHIHAFYVEYVYYNRQEQGNVGVFDNTRAPGVYSDNVQTGGRGYGTMPPPATSGHVN